MDTEYRAATFGDAVWAEWMKTRTHRPIGWIVLTAAALTIAVGALSSASAAGRCEVITEGCTGLDATRSSLRGCLFAQFALGFLGVLSVTSEHTTGMIRASLVAAPRRGRLLAAKAVVTFVIALLVGAVASLAAFLVGQWIWIVAGHDVAGADLGSPGVLPAVAGAGLYLALMALAGVALGFLVWTTTGGFVVLLGVALLVPALGPVLPAPWEELLERYWPTSAGAQVMSVQRDAQTLQPWAGLGVLALAVAGALLAGLIAFRRREF